MVLIYRSLTFSSISIHFYSASLKFITSILCKELSDFVWFQSYPRYFLVVSRLFIEQQHDKDTDLKESCASLGSRNHLKRRKISNHSPVPLSFKQKPGNIQKFLLSDADLVATAKLSGSLVVQNILVVQVIITLKNCYILF